VSLAVAQRVSPHATPSAFAWPRRGSRADNHLLSIAQLVRGHGRHFAGRAAAREAKGARAFVEVIARAGGVAPAFSA
jgi:hypothetical protein